MGRPIVIGDALRVRDAKGDWHDALAISVPEGEWLDGCKVHDFPIVHVRVMGVDQEMPWPLTDVESPLDRRTTPTETKDES